jgi:hypothetical protein
MYSAEDVKVGNGSKYQSAGVSENVMITEVTLNHNEQWNTKSITLKTINENKQEGQSKRLSLTTTIKEGSQIAAWKISAKYLLNVIMSATGKTLEEAQAVLECKDDASLIKNLESTLIGKSFRGLFSQREYQPGKYAVELYTTEPIGGTRLVWDAKNQYYNKPLPSVSISSLGGESVPSDGLPF